MTTVFSIVLVLVCPSGSLADEEHKASVTVQLVNQTANGSPVAGDEISLTIYNQSRQIGHFSAVADENGMYVFNDVPACTGFVAVANAKHNNMSFGGHALELKPGHEAFNVQVTVYEVSEDNSKLSVLSHHLIIKSGRNSIWITEYIQINNPLDMAVISAQKDNDGKNIVLDMKLPNGFKDFSCVQYFLRNALVITNDGFYDTMAIPPGRHQTAFTYRIPIDSETVDITKLISMPTSDFMIFSQLGSAALVGVGTSLGQVKMDDGNLSDYYQLGSYKNGDEITFQATGFNVGPSDRKAIAILSVIFAVAAIPVLLRVFRRGGSAGYSS